MKKQILECDFSTDKDRGFTWFRNYQGVATATLSYDGYLQFDSGKHRVLIENIGTPDEKVFVTDISDLNDP